MSPNSAPASPLAVPPRIEAGEWWAIFAGPLAWALDEGTSYALTQHACSTGHFYVLHLMTIVSLCISISGFWMGLTGYRRLTAKANTHGHQSRDRAFFVSSVGAAMSVFFTVIVVAEAVPRWILSPCS